MLVLPFHHGISFHFIPPVATQAALANEHARFNESQTASTSEVETLKIKLTDFEREKRDLIGVIARLRTEDEEREGRCLYLLPCL
jgi:hypothetical protein